MKAILGRLVPSTVTPEPSGAGRGSGRRISVKNPRFTGWSRRSSERFEPGSAVITVLDAMIHHFRGHAIGGCPGSIGWQERRWGPDETHAVRSNPVSRSVRTRKQVGRLLPVAVDVPADQVLSTGRCHVVARRRPRDPAFGRRFEEHREQLLPIRPAMPAHQFGWTPNYPAWDGTKRDRTPAIEFRLRCFQSLWTGRSKRPECSVPSSVARHPCKPPSGRCQLGAIPRNIPTASRRKTTEGRTRRFHAATTSGRHCSRLRRH